MAEDWKNFNRLEEVENSLRYHSAISPDNKAKFEALRAEAIEFARRIEENTPPSREQSLAYIHLEETLMWAIKSVAIRDEFNPDPQPE
jgi:hypothetical protein